MSRKISVVCLKWGAPYPAEYVNVLQRAVRNHLSYRHQFVCITDNCEGLLPDVKVIPLPEIPLDRNQWVPGMWPKLAIFKEGLFSADEIVLYLDVDVLISDSLDPFVDLVSAEGGLRIIREWNPEIWHYLPEWVRPDRGGNSSLVCFIAGDQYHLFSRFVADPVIKPEIGNDQLFITEYANCRRYWPDGWCASFRRSCVPHWPLNLISGSIKKPSRPKIFIFHGVPNPTDMVADGNYRWGTKWRYGFGPVKWVQDYWRKYSIGSQAD
jgi:hypothetical protein